MAVEIRDIPEEVSELTMLMGRRPDSPHADMDAHHKSLGSFNGAAMAVAELPGAGLLGAPPFGRGACSNRRRSGRAHPDDGRRDEGPETITMTKGQLLIVPTGVWHRFTAPDGVTLMAATPQPSDHCYAADPRDEV